MPSHPLNNPALNNPALNNPALIKPLLSDGQRLLGLDLGSKTIGLALSDVSLTIASPLTTISRTQFRKDAELIIALTQEHGVGGLILGLPINMNGSEGPACQAARAFAHNLAKCLPLPLAFQDERLSTAAVNKTLISADTSRVRRKKLVDKLAAAYILQGALDRLANQTI